MKEKPTALKLYIHVHAIRADALIGSWSNLPPREQVRQGEYKRDHASCRVAGF